MDEQKIIATNLAKNYVIKERGLFGRKKKIVSAVKDISLEIPKGKIIGVLGINGAGKTTTIRMLASIIAPSSGTLTMNGVDAVKNHRWVKERINVISGGERNLYWRLTAIENLKYFGSLYGLSGVELKEKIAELLKIVGLEEAEDIPVERYSKGMKQPYLRGLRVKFRYEPSQPCDHLRAILLHRQQRIQSDHRQHPDLREDHE